MAPPAYDSGWVSLNQDEARVLVHNLGGNGESYLVDMLYNEGAGTFDGVNARNFGGMDVGTKPSGGVIVQRAARQCEHRTQQFTAELAGVGVHDLPPLLDREFSRLETFFTSRSILRIQVREQIHKAPSR